MKIDQLVIRRYDAMFKLGRTPWVRTSIPEIVKYFAQLVIKNGNNQKLLDLGCGNGWISRYFADGEINVQGIDSSESAIQEAKKFQISHTHFTLGNALDFPFKEKEFDAVFDRGMFHHQPEINWPQYKKGLNRILKSGGLFYLGVFSDKSVKHGFSPKKTGKMWQKARDENGYLFYDHFFNKNLIQKIFCSKFTILSCDEDTSPSKDGSLLLNCVLRKR